MNHIWLNSAAERYEKCNRLTFEWLLSRAPLNGGFLDTKVNSITGTSYEATSGLRGPAFTYGWIQGRGLEALITFADHYSELYPTFSEKLLGRAKLLFDSLRNLYQRDGHFYFLYDSDFKPIKRTDFGASRQTRESGLFTYADAFVAKGLFAASTVFAPTETKCYLKYLFDVIDAVEDGRFQMDENHALSREMITAEHDDFGPRMILLGAAGLLHRHEHAHLNNFADRFIDHILANYYQPSSRLLLNIPDHDICNVGHGIEFCGFALEHLAEKPDDTRLPEIITILQRSLDIGLQGPGIALYLSAKTGHATSPHFPWWPMPEAARACALGLHLGASKEILDLWKKADDAFFNNYWQADHSYAFQTRNIDMPVDYVPATPDLDPGYHTGLSFLTATQTIRDHLVR